MAGIRSAITILVALLGLGVTACSTLDVNDYCRYSDKISLRQADPESLALFLGISKGRAKETPFVVVRGTSEKSRGASVTLQATPAAHPMPTGLDESSCARVDWRTYSLTVDTDEWSAFWQDERNLPFEIFLGFLDSNGQLMMSDFGAAMVDTNTGNYLVACGCYWK